MFEKFVNGKINSEIDEIKNFQNFSKGNIIKSKLSEFTKNYLLSDTEIIETEESIADAINKSNKLYFNFTIRPKWTLLTFLFNNFESRPPNEVLTKLNCFPFYKFYSDSISEFINDNSPIFVTKTEIATIIGLTNKAIYNRLTTDISNVKIKNFFLQIFLLKYANVSEYNLESTIPFPFIKIFIEDKSYIDLLEKFNNVKSLSGDNDISLKDIIKILTDKFTVVESDKKHVQIELIENIKTGEAENKVIPKASGKKQDVKKSETLYSQELEKAVKSDENKIQIKENEVDKDESLINTLFTDKHSEKITENIYQSDIIKRVRSFRKLENIKTWKEASLHLKEIFKNNSVDLYNKDVISFVNILNEHYKKSE